jgi:hypothetical protein
MWFGVADEQRSNSNNGLTQGSYLRWLGVCWQLSKADVGSAVRISERSAVGGTLAVGRFAFHSLDQFRIAELTSLRMALSCWACPVVLRASGLEEIRSYRKRSQGSPGWRAGLREVAAQASRVRRPW